MQQRAVPRVECLRFVLGFGSKKYKWEWPYMPRKCRLDALRLDTLCSYHQVKEWALEGGSLAESLGGVTGAHTHTQESSTCFAIR